MNLLLRKGKIKVNNNTVVQFPLPEKIMFVTSTDAFIYLFHTPDLRFEII